MVTPAIRRAFLGALLGLLAASAALASPAHVRLLATGPASLRFVADVPEARFERAASDSTRSTLVIEGYGAKGGPGRVAVPVRWVMVAVPPTGEVAVSAIGSAEEIREGVRLEGAAGAALPLARVEDVSWMRNQRVARVAIAPAAYDGRTGRLSIRHRVEVEVSVGAAPPASPAPAPDAFEGLYRASLVNYEQGRAWRRAAQGRGAATAARTAALTSVPTTSVYAGRNWVKIPIPRAGFYRVEFGQLRNTALFAGRTTITHDQLRLFTWPGVPVLPEDSYCDSCDYKEVAIQVVDGGAGSAPGVFDNNADYFYFFAMGASDWADRYDATRPDTDFVDHPYETFNYVYLTIDESANPVPGAPARIATTSGAFTPSDTLVTPTPAAFTERAHLEVDDEYWPHATPIIGVNPDGTYRRSSEAWEKFFWTSLTEGAQFATPVPLPGLAAASPVRMRLRVWGLSSLIPGIEKSSGVADHYLDVTAGDPGPGALAFHRSWNGLTPQTLDTTATGWSESGSTLVLQVPDVPDPNPNLNHSERDGLAWLDAFYPRRFEASGNALVFESDPAGGAHLYRLSSFTLPLASAPRIFDVTDPLAPVEILGADYRDLGGGEHDLRFLRTEAGRRVYRVFADSAIVKPLNTAVADAPSSSRQNLRRPLGAMGQPVQADYLLIYYDGFRAAADTLLKWRREHLPLATAAYYDTFSVPISALYDQFSGGRTDPSAIRNFLRAAFNNWGTKPPAFVTFLGDASYDFKNLSGQAPSGQPGTLVPTYENAYDDLVARQFSTDDWMLNVDDPAVVIPDFFGGRIPARSADQAMRYVRDKLLPYERVAPQGEWHDRVMLVADDDKQGVLDDPLGWTHLAQTVQLDVNDLPPEVDRDYVYLHTYPGVGTKPLAKDAMLGGMEAGTVLVNYVGHGSPFKIADESVMIDDDAEALTNRDRPTVFVAASCDVGKFDNPGVISLGEKILLNPQGGAVAVVSATDEAFSTLNATLNQVLFEQAFGRDTLTGQFDMPLSQAMLTAKNGIVNSQKYQLMGDAAVRLALPRLTFECGLRDLDGIPVIQAARGQTVDLLGRLLDRPGGTLQTLDGLARLLIEDSAPVDTAPGCGGCVAYPFRAAPLFRGDVAVKGGQFTARFVVPMDARLGPRARARAYGELTQGAFATDGVGASSWILAPGALPGGDHEGPRITLGFTGGSSSVRPGAELRVDLFDPSGILVTAHTPQNDIIVTVDDNSAQRYDITSTFRCAANSYQAGTAFFRLPGLNPGRHHIKVSAADNLAAGITAAEHRSSATIDFEVTENPILRVTRALLFPNPVRSGGPGGGGQFVIDAPGDSVNVLLRLYTVSGRLIRTLEWRGGLAQVQIPWDGLDAEGWPLARGVYLFKAQVYPRGPGGDSQGSRKAEGEGRFVVVGR